MLDKIHAQLDAAYDDMVEIRRYLHQHPELSFHENETAKYIANFYKKLGIPYVENIGGNGIVATLEGGKLGKTVALRADFDALPIQDEKDVPYKSTVSGVMHACGHDGHTATLLTLARIVKDFQSEIPGNIKFIHQHAEELAPGGAKPMIEAGCLEDVDAVFGTHLWATTPLGTLETSKEALMAGADRFEITIQGQGGHGAQPHETKDAVVIGATLVNQLQQIVSRHIDPLKTAVVTIGAFHAGETFNIIADKATLTGTVRYLDESVQEQIIEDIKRISQGVCDASGATYEIDYFKGYPPLINHAEEAELVRLAGEKIADINLSHHTLPIMAAEDFAYYMLEKPGAFFFTGARLDGKAYPHHHPKFDIDERALPIAAKTLIQAYFDYQEKESF